MVYITSRRHADRAYPVTDVRVYSNASAVRLTQNGKAVGNGECNDRVCVWRGVKLNAGENTFVANANFAGRAVSDSVNWNAPDAARGLRIDAGDFVGHVSADGARIGSDNFFTGGEAKLLNAGTPPERRGTLAATRTFAVAVNGKPQLKAWSPARAAGGALKATQVRFPARVTDGWLKLRFEPGAGPAVVSAISVTP